MFRPAGQEKGVKRAESGRCKGASRGKIAEKDSRKRRGRGWRKVRKSAVLKAFKNL